MIKTSRSHCEKQIFSTMQILEYQSRVQTFLKAIYVIVHAGYPDEQRSKPGRSTREPNTIYQQFLTAYCVVRRQYTSILNRAPQSRRNGICDAALVASVFFP
jgi:hypothetical protein